MPLEVSGERLARECAAAGCAAAIADGFFNPSTVLQVRGQLAPSASTWSLARQALDSAGVIRGLWLPGLQAICMRALTYSGFRVGCYPTMRDALPGNGFGNRVLAGAFTGGVGAFIFAPIELVRVRMVGPKPYASTNSAFGTIVREESLSALWRGAPMFAVRCGCFSGMQLATCIGCTQTCVVSQVECLFVSCHRIRGHRMVRPGR